MDTISRENNSMLPIAGIILGVAGLIIGAYAAISISKVKTRLDAAEEKVAKIDDLASQVSAAQSASDKASKDITSLQNSTQSVVSQIATELAALHDTVKHLEESKHPAASAKGGGSHEPAVAGPGEYIVKAGDSGAKIARNEGVSLKDLESVNPGVNWTKLKPGDKLKLPEKK